MEYVPKSIQSPIDHSTYSRSKEFPIAYSEVHSEMNRLYLYLPQFVDNPKQESRWPLNSQSHVDQIHSDYNWRTVSHRKKENQSGTQTLVFIRKISIEI